jgi:protein-export membrane protein SecD
MFANIGVLFNILLLLASLSLLGATLTLPGIAGIALMVGMAVDANILIYERIREETRAGQRPAIAIDSGFKRAMATIVDSNLTTLIGAVLMYQFGTGPIRGFAVTLALGIIISMFTAITLTRVLIGSWLAWKKPKTLSI